MADEIVTGRVQSTSDESLLAATGKTWNEWFAVLDAADATGLKHPQIVAVLVEMHGVGAWWAQGITVGYEQARGMRMPGQRADGTFEVSASKAIDGSQAEALAAVIAAVSADLGAPASVSETAKYATARWKLDGRESLLATADPAKSGKTRVALTHQKMATHAQLAPAKERAAEWLRSAADGS